MNFIFEHSIESLSLVFFGMFVCYAALSIYRRLKIDGYQAIGRAIIQKAEEEAVQKLKANEIAFKQRLLDQQQENEQFLNTEKKKLAKEEERIKQREDKLEARLSLNEKKLAEIEKRETNLLSQERKLQEEKAACEANQKTLIAELERLSGLSASEARETLTNKIFHEVQAESALKIRRAVKEAEEEAERQAKAIVVTAINRLNVSQVSEATINTVAIPNEDIKGRIIGREGRNIRALERATGVNFIMDDTPGAIVLSGFDPIRLHIAKLALTELVLDGRIHPTRIEEVVEKASAQVTKLIKYHGEDASVRAGAFNLHPELSLLLGKLKFRFSYGQNILEHSLEVSHIMGIMAAELGLDIALAKRIGLLHDIGKALTHEIEGSHAKIGHDIALKYGETKQVANGIGSHHHEMNPETLEASLCCTADALSASRPGARIEAVEEYVKRLKRLEDLAYEFEGVERAYALQAGRELRVIVAPNLIDDDGLLLLSRELTRRIEKELSYPGKIKITTVREKRITEYAF